MVHSDDKGVVLPPPVAPFQVHACPWYMHAISGTCMPLCVSDGGTVYLNCAGGTVYLNCAGGTVYLNCACDLWEGLPHGESMPKCLYLNAVIYRWQWPCLVPFTFRDIFPTWSFFLWLRMSVYNTSLNTYIYIYLYMHADKYENTQTHTQIRTYVHSGCSSASWERKGQRC
jgi:hypothetical protein